MLGIAIESGPLANCDTRDDPVTQDEKEDAIACILGLGEKTPKQCVREILNSVSHLLSLDIS